MKPAAAATVVIQLNQGEGKERAVIVPFLNFLWLLSLFQDKESDKKHGIEILRVIDSNCSNHYACRNSSCFVFLFP